MKQRKVIAAKNLPSRLPVSLTIILYLLLDRFDSPQWAWTLVITFVVLWWVAAITLLYKQTPVNIFKKKTAIQDLGA